MLQTPPGKRQRGDGHVTISCCGAQTRHHNTKHIWSFSQNVFHICHIIDNHHIIVPQKPQEDIFTLTRPLLQGSNTQTVPTWRLRKCAHGIYSLGMNICRQHHRHAAWVIWSPRVIIALPGQRPLVQGFGWHWPGKPTPTRVTFLFLANFTKTQDHKKGIRIPTKQPLPAPGSQARWIPGCTERPCTSIFRPT